MITFSQQDAAGLVARAKGHRQYYGAVFTGGKAVIYKQKNEKRIVLVEKEYSYKIDETYGLKFVLKGEELSLYCDGELILQTNDSEYSFGQAGFVVDSGAILGDGFVVERV